MNLTHTTKDEFADISRQRVNSIVNTFSLNSGIKNPNAREIAKAYVAALPKPKQYEGENYLGELENSRSGIWICQDPDADMTTKSGRIAGRWYLNISRDHPKDIRSFNYICSGECYEPGELSITQFQSRIRGRCLPAEKAFSFFIDHFIKFGAQRLLILDPNYIPSITHKRKYGLLVDNSFIAEADRIAEKYRKLIKEYCDTSSPVVKRIRGAKLVFYNIML